MSNEGFAQFSEGKQKTLMQSAIAKAGSERKLAKLAGIPTGSISSLKQEKRNISMKYLKRVSCFLNIRWEDSGYSILLPRNWGQIKGGRNLIEKKTIQGSMEETIQRLKEASSRRMHKWHTEMKATRPIEYHRWQYERFKKVGRGYCCTLANGTKVRNLLEQEVGNFLFNRFSAVEYEPYLNACGSTYFPDFLCQNVVIEVTGWKHPSSAKLHRLFRKIKDLESEGYAVCFYIPMTHRKFYKCLTCPTFSDLKELEEFIDASVA